MTRISKFKLLFRGLFVLYIQMYPIKFTFNMTISLQLRFNYAPFSSMIQQLRKIPDLLWKMLTRTLEHLQEKKDNQ